MSLSLFINLATPAFAGLKQQIEKDSEQLSAQLEEFLQEEYAKKKPTSDPTEEALKACLEKNNYGKCEEYIKEINKLFTDTRDKIENGKEGKEESYKPLSQKEYTKQLQKNTEEEYKKQALEIEKQYQAESKKIEYEYRGVLFNTPEYSNYLMALSELKKWQKENEENLNAWQKEISNNETKYYQQYLKEFDRSVKEYKEDKEKVLREYFKELANNLMQVYAKADIASRMKMLDLFVMLLSMESSDVKFFNSAQRSEIYRFLSKIVNPGNNVNPCRFHTRARYDSEMSDYYAYMEQTSAAEEARRSTLAIRDQTAKQARPYEQMIENALSAPITELVDEQSCQNAMTAMNGLSFFKGWEMLPVIVFMMNNVMEPMAQQILLMGTKTLIEANRPDQLYVLAKYMHDKEGKYEKEDELKLKEAIFYEGKFYTTPYISSRYDEAAGGGDAWRDMAQMLANEKTLNSVYAQQQILDTSVSIIIGTEKIRFHNNLPFIYGLILYNPKVIDEYIPESSLPIHGKTYTVNHKNGDRVYYQYGEDGGYLFTRSQGNISRISNDTRLYDLANDVQTTVSNVIQEYYKNTKESFQKQRDSYGKFFKDRGLKPSEFFAKAFYDADFVDLTVEEKLAMDKALEKKYSYLKKFSKGHKEKLQTNRRNAGIVDATLIVIDVALTVWCIADLYKLAKWGIKGIKALRTLVKAGKTAAGLSTARRVAFFRTIIAENKEVINVHRRIKKIKSIPSRIKNKFPAYSGGIELTRVSHDGQRMLNVVKLDGTPVMVGRNTKKGQIVESEFSKIMMGTKDYMATPAGMPGQRLAVQHYNKYVVAGGTNTFWKKTLKTVQVAKTYGPIQIFKKDGTTPLEYKKIKFNDEGFFEVDGDFLKTFKATMEPEDILKYNKLLEGTIADLEKTLAATKDRFAYLTKNMDILTAEELAEYEKLNNTAKLLEQLKGKRYITLRAKNQSTTFAEKWRLHKKSYNVVPLYDVQGNVIANVSLDMALNNSKILSKSLAEGKTLLLKDNKIWLGNEVLDVSIGAPKEVINMMAKAGRKVEDFSFLTLTKKRSKMLPLYVNNALSLSAGSTSLNMSLNQAPFNNPNDPHYIPQPIIFGISVGFPYAFSLLSPMAAPFVKRFGVSNVQTAALIIGGTGLTYSAVNGYYGFASKKRNSTGWPIYDENGHTITADRAPSYFPLIVASLGAGVSSSLTRASLNTAIHRFSTSKASMTVSMLAKNIGSLSMTLIPWGAEAVFGKDNVDFSISYPVLALLALTGIGLMKGFIPTSVGRELNYKIMPNKTTRIPRLRDLGDASREIFKPFTLFASSKIMPYYLSYLSFGATESYALFKTYNTFTRDSVETFMTDKGTSKNTNKFLASFAVTLPSALVRGFVKRKTGLSQGIFNSIVLTSLGIGGLMLPGDNHSNAWNIGVGTLSGILLACGTANMYQYLQRKMIAGLSNTKIEGVLPLARKFNGVTGLTTTAISFYSGAYIGSFIPYAYSFLAEEKVTQGATDFEANQSVLPLALGVYGLGTIPLFFTPVGRNLITKVSPYTPLFSVPAGSFAIRNLYQQSNRQQMSLPLPYTPKINNELPRLNFNPVQPALQLMPYQEFKIKPFVVSEPKEEKAEE